MNQSPGAERARPVLGQQPPLPGDDPVAIRFVHPDTYEEQNALVPMSPYFEDENYDYDSNQMIREPYENESTSMKSSNPQMKMGNVQSNDGFTLSQGKLMFIANQGM